MDFEDTPEESRFRREVRAWLTRNRPRSRAAFRRDSAFADEASWPALVAWHKRLHAGGWIGLSWPKEYGGRGATLMEQVIFDEELQRARLPPGCNVLGILMAGPAIMHFGTEEQRRAHLARILSGDEIWIEGLSEPGAGSDLASLRTHAIEDGDDFVVNGQKVWTTMAHRGDWIQLFVRTDPEAPRTRGLSCLLLDMKSAGITVRPLRQMTGEAEFSEVFFEDVRVPRRNLLGARNGGWQVLIATLMHERAGIGELGSELLVEPLIQLAKFIRRNGRPASEDAYVRQRIAAFAIEVKARKLTGLRTLTKRLRGEPPGPEGSIGKLAATELAQRMARFAIELGGARVLLDGGSPFAIDEARWRAAALSSPSLTIAGGT
ncbi:MAG: acyl-CoA dehydrogenase family protein, partial [Candidatus Binatia bacterium]